MARVSLLVPAALALALLSGCKTDNTAGDAVKSVAAAVCGVSVDALAASFANGHGTCTATTTTPQLNQIVQQQISTGGDVNGGDQTLNTNGAA